MTDTTIKTQKKVLRDHARYAAVLHCLLPRSKKKAHESARSCENVLEGIDPVMVYVSKPLEVNTRHLIEYLIAEQRTGNCSGD